jgi:cytochrome c553
MSNRAFRIAAAAALVALAPAGVLAQPQGNVDAGGKKASMCQGCHGVEGYRIAYPGVYAVPRLGGQHPQYIVAALQGYKRGERPYATMRAIAASLSDQDMADLAAYYGRAATVSASSK